MEKLIKKLSENIDREGVHIIGVSGGKDSGACIALATYLKLNAVFLFCDTGHEKMETLSYLHSLDAFTQRPIVHLKKEVTEEQFKAKRDRISSEWREWYVPQLRTKASKALGVRHMYPPVPEEKIKEALALLHPTGDAFRDLLVLHGTMPQKTGKFCSLELKTELAWDYISEYLDSSHEGEEVFWWSGVRAQESPVRAGLPISEPCGMDGSGYVTSLRPILDLTHEQVFELCEYVGVPHNPLYTQGDKRVGCGECFEANKRAIRNSFTRAPYLLYRTKMLEEVVAKVNRRAIQLNKKYVPFFREAYRLKQYDNWASAEQVFEWSKQGRGSGEEIIINSCDSVYGLCE